MKRWVAAILAAFLILSGCTAQDAPSTTPEPAQTEPVQADPAEAASDAAPDDSSEDVTAETPLVADDLPESCRAYFDTAARCGPAETVEGTHAAANASDGVSQVYGVHLPDGEFADLRQSAGADGVTVEEFSNGGAVRESAGAWRSRAARCIWPRGCGSARATWSSPAARSSSPAAQTPSAATTATCS